MNGFFWSAGHLGWGVFAVAVFTILWWLLSDLAWRLKRTSIFRLAVVAFTGWLVGVCLLVLAFYLRGR